jgi:hypothetical protein
MVAVGVVGLVIVLLLVALLSGGGTSNHATSSTTTAHGHGAHTHRTVTHAPSSSQIVSLSLTPTARVYVCLIGEGGRKLIPGSELQPGASTPTFHSRRFEITLGNASVTMFIDGRARAVPPSSQPIGYVITKANGRRSLAPGQLPTCT